MKKNGRKKNSTTLRYDMHFPSLALKRQCEAQAAKKIGRSLNTFLIEAAISKLREEAEVVK